MKMVQDHVCDFVQDRFFRFGKSMAPLEFPAFHMDKPIVWVFADIDRELQCAHTSRWSV
jgi:hypothetical protein